ncbi:MAG TPA: type IV secretion system protein [Acetobacteraceae bacterium]|nr:type IV secretion system protein [Acetobacteraceae bacterium]
MRRYSRWFPLGALLASLVIPAAAHAQMPVIDGASLAQLVNDVRVAQQQYQQLVQSYDQLRETYQALAQAVNPNQWAQQLEQPFLEDPLPNTNIVPSLLNGLSPPSMLGGNLGSLAQQYLGENQVYQPQGTDFEATQIRNAANSTAEIEAVATQNLQSLQLREADLTQLQSQLSSAGTLQQVASIQARLTAEQNYVQAQTAQAENLQILANEQIANQREAQDQAARQSADEGMRDDCTALAQLGASDPGCP